MIKADTPSASGVVGSFVRPLEIRCVPCLTSLRLDSRMFVCDRSSGGSSGCRLRGGLCECGVLCEQSRRGAVQRADGRRSRHSDGRGSSSGGNASHRCTSAHRGGMHGGRGERERGWEAMHSRSSLTERPMRPRSRPSRWIHSITQRGQRDWLGRHIVISLYSTLRRSIVVDEQTVSLAFELAGRCIAPPLSLPCPPPPRAFPRRPAGADCRREWKRPRTRSGHCSPRSPHSAQDRCRCPGSQSAAAHSTANRHRKVQADAVAGGSEGSCNSRNRHPMRRRPARRGMLSTLREQSSTREGGREGGRMGDERGVGARRGNNGRRRTLSLRLTLSVMLSACVLTAALLFPGSVIAPLPFRCIRCLISHCLIRRLAVKSRSAPLQDEDG